MANGRNDPFSGANFLVTVSGVSEDGARAAFSEVSGLGVQIEPIEYRSGGDPTIRKIPGIRKYTNIVLKRGITSDKAFWEWIRQAGNGQLQMATVRIVLLNDAGEQVLRWTARESWPCKWEGPYLNANGNDVAIESIEICHEGLDLD